MRTSIIEGVLIWFLILASLYEGFRLTFYKDAFTLFDAVGPGPIILALAFIMIIASFFHFIPNIRKPPRMDREEATSKEMKIKVCSMIAVCMIYIFLISILGYLFATILFFLMAFRVEKIKSWRLNLVLTVVFALGFYLLFIEYAGMVFPRGVFGEISLIGFLRKL